MGVTGGLAGVVLVQEQLLSRQPSHVFVCCALDLLEVGLEGMPVISDGRR